MKDISNVKVHLKGLQWKCKYCNMYILDLMSIFSILLQAGVDMNAKDNDGWTALHAAAHWGQEEACKILAENMCDMESKNLAVLYRIIVF